MCWKAYILATSSKRDSNWDAVDLLRDSSTDLRLVVYAGEYFVIRRNSIWRIRKVRCERFDAVRARERRSDMQGGFVDALSGRRFTSRFAVAFCSISLTFFTSRMSGLDGDALDLLLSRIYAKHLVPHELRLQIYSLLDLSPCLACNLLYTLAGIHCCIINPTHLCIDCVPPHFCLSLSIKMLRLDKFS